MRGPVSATKVELRRGRRCERLSLLRAQFSGVSIAPHGFLCRIASRCVVGLLAPATRDEISATVRRLWTFLEGWLFSDTNVEKISPSKSSLVSSRELAERGLRAAQMLCRERRTISNR